LKSLLYIICKTRLGRNNYITSATVILIEMLVTTRADVADLCVAIRVPPLIVDRWVNNHATISIVIRLRSDGVVRTRVLIPVTVE